MGMDIAVLGVDLGKTVCSVVGLDTSGAVVMRRKVRRETLIALAEKLPPCVVLAWKPAAAPIMLAGY
jgi:transposase